MWSTIRDAGRRTVREVHFLLALTASTRLRYLAVRVAILEPFSGISGDMTLGALLDVGLDPEWLRALPGRLALEGVGVRIAEDTGRKIRGRKLDLYLSSIGACSRFGVRARNVYILD